LHQMGILLCDFFITKFGVGRDFQVRSLTPNVCMYTVRHNSGTPIFTINGIT